MPCRPFCAAAGAKDEDSHCWWSELMRAEHNDLVNPEAPARLYLVKKKKKKKGGGCHTCSGCFTSVTGSMRDTTS